jgi:signal transduction histidine kinase
VARVPTLLAPVLADSLALASVEAREFDVQLLQAPLPAGLSVMGDGLRLGQVLANLLSNACKYNRPGGTARLAVRRQAEQVLIEVEDQGQGLAEAELAQLFQPFKRLPATAHLRGTGLGLSIVKLLVEQMGGTISVRSQPGRGCVFSVALDAAPDAAPSPSPDSSWTDTGERGWVSTGR